MGDFVQLITALGVGSIVVHLLTTGGDREYDRCYDGYSRLLKATRNLLEGNIDSQGIGVEVLAAEIDQAWIYASDDVIRICNEITNSGRRHDNITVDSESMFSRLVMAMRQDLKQKRSLFYRIRFWGKSRLTKKDYLLIGPKRK